MTKPKRMEYRGRGIPEHIREGVIQMYAITDNKSECARTFGISLGSVYKILGEKDPEFLREKRREAMGEIAGKMTTRVTKIVDDLEPPEDATFMQKATVAGILTDKVAVLDRRLDEHKREEQPMEITMPENVETMVGVIRNDLKSLAVIIGVKFPEEITEEARKLEDEIGARLVEVEGEVTKVDDLDVGGDGS